MLTTELLIGAVQANSRRLYLQSMPGFDREEGFKPYDARYPVMTRPVDLLKSNTYGPAHRHDIRRMIPCQSILAYSCCVKQARLISAIILPFSMNLMNPGAALD